MIHINGRRKNNHIAYYRGPPPGFDNPQAWFEFTDHPPPPKGNITQEQILNSINANLRPRNTTQRVFIRSRIQNNWTKWDPHHSMRLNKNEFIHCGIISFLNKLEREFLDVFRTQNKRQPANATNRRETIGRPPPLSDTKRWFEHYDFSDDGYLSQEEVTQGLFETLKAKGEKEKECIRDSIERSWPVFDDDYSGKIDKWEFLVKGGLHDYLILFEQEWKERPSDRSSCNFLSLHVKGSLRHSYVMPPPISQPRRWFDHFDIDRSGYLTAKETINGLYSTFNATSSERRKAIRKIVTSSWDDYDLNDDGLISLDEFIRDGGLAGCFQGYETYWKEDLESIVEDNDEDSNEVVKVQVQIPKDKTTGDVLQVSSPKTQDMLVVLIPEKVKWGGGENEPYFFTLKF